MSQESFGAVQMVPVASHYRRFVLAVTDAVESVGLGTAAGRCGLRPQDLSDMLNGVKGRRIPNDVGAAIAGMVSGDLRAAIWNANREMYGMVEPESDADYIRRLEDGYARLGEVGRIELAKHRREARR
jgi:hypothetical protein